MSSPDHSLDEKMFQDDEAFDNVIEEPLIPLYQRRSLLRQWLLSGCLHLSLILLYTALFIAATYSKSASTSHGPGLVYCKYPPVAGRNVTCT